MRYDTQNIFFVSDFHVSHKNILTYDKRPFVDINEMHTTLIKNWNEVVTDDDVVYYLGDLSFGRCDLTKWFIYSLKGKIHFILGNHDKMRDIAKLGRFDHIHEYGTEIYVKDDVLKSARGSDGYQQIIMSHYPIFSWNRAHYGSWHLHGHCHGSLMKSYPDFYKRKVMDVGCSETNYTPLSYTQTKDGMSKKLIASVDHHE